MRYLRGLWKARLVFCKKDDLGMCWPLGCCTGVFEEDAMGWSYIFSALDTIHLSYSIQWILSFTNLGFHGLFLPVHFLLPFHVFHNRKQHCPCGKYVGYKVWVGLNWRMVNEFKPAEMDRGGRAEAAAVKGSLQYFCWLLLTQHRGEHDWLL